MRGVRVFSFLSFVTGVGLTLASTEACTKTCTEVGCNSGVTINAYPPQGASLQGATFGICLNGKCSSGSAAAEGGAPVDPSRVEMNGEVGLQIASISGGAVAFQYTEDASNAASKIHLSGDTYRVSIVGADKSTIVDATRTVTYPNTSQPNGPDCDPTCHNATVDVAAQ